MRSSRGCSTCWAASLEDSSLYVVAPSTHRPSPIAATSRSRCNRRGRTGLGRRAPRGLTFKSVTLYTMPELRILAAVLAAAVPLVVSAQPPDSEATDHGPEEHMPIDVDRGLEWGD